MLTRKRWLPSPKGAQNERRAERELRRHGLVLVERNYQCRQGEVDLIMRAPDTSLVFVEVRYRSNRSHGSALDSVDHHKQRRLVQAARHYLATHPDAASAACRFDVVAVEESAGIRWVSNAFFAE